MFALKLSQKEETNRVIDTQFTAAAQSPGSAWVGGWLGELGSAEQMGRIWFRVGPGEHQTHSLKLRWLFGWLLCQ